jgi:hypothetical protein
MLSTAWAPGFTVEDGTAPAPANVKAVIFLLEAVISAM